MGGMFMVKSNISRMLFLFSVQATEPQHCDVLRETEH